MNRFLASSLAFALASPLAAQPAPPPSQDTAALFAAQNRIPDMPGDGPYPAMMEVDSGLPDHVIYRPADLSGLGGKKLGVFVWGNGACADDATIADRNPGGHDDPCSQPDIVADPHVPFPLRLASERQPRHKLIVGRGDENLGSQ